MIFKINNGKIRTQKTCHFIIILNSSDMKGCLVGLFKTLHNQNHSHKADFGPTWFVLFQSLTSWPLSKRQCCPDVDKVCRRKSDHGRYSYFRWNSQYLDPFRGLNGQTQPLSKSFAPWFDKDFLHSCFQIHPSSFISWYIGRLTLWWFFISNLCHPHSHLFHRVYCNCYCLRIVIWYSDLKCSGL